MVITPMGNKINSFPVRRGVGVLREKKVLSIPQPLRSGDSTEGVKWEEENPRVTNYPLS
jgi:hypothetical protein